MTHHIAATDIGAETAERLAECAHRYIDLAFMRGTKAETLRAVKAGRVRFIDIKHRFITLCDSGQDIQVGTVTIHAEHAFTDNDDGRALLMLLTRKLFQMVVIIMLETRQARAA